MPRPRKVECRAGGIVEAGGVAGLLEFLPKQREGLLQLALPHELLTLADGFRLRSPSFAEGLGC